MVTYRSESDAFMRRNKVDPPSAAEMGFGVTALVSRKRMPDGEERGGVSDTSSPDSRHEGPYVGSVSKIQDSHAGGDVGFPDWDGQRDTGYGSVGGFGLFSPLPPAEEAPAVTPRAFKQSILKNVAGLVKTLGTIAVTLTLSACSGQSFQQTLGDVRSLALEGCANLPLGPQSCAQAVTAVTPEQKKVVLTPTGQVPAGEWQSPDGTATQRPTVPQTQRGLSLF